MSSHSPAPLQPMPILIYPYSTSSLLPSIKLVTEALDIAFLTDCNLRFVLHVVEHLDPPQVTDIGVVIRQIIGQFQINLHGHKTRKEVVDLFLGVNPRVDRPEVFEGERVAHCVPVREVLLGGLECGGEDGRLRNKKAAAAAAAAVVSHFHCWASSRFSCLPCRRHHPSIISQGNVLDVVIVMNNAMHGRPQPVRRVHKAIAPIVPAITEVRRRPAQAGRTGWGRKEMADVGLGGEAIGTPPRSVVENDPRGQQEKGQVQHNLDGQHPIMLPTFLRGELAKRQEDAAALIKANGDLGGRRHGCGLRDGVGGS